MGEIISTGEERKSNPRANIVKASPMDQNMSRKAVGTPPSGGQNNVMDLADHKSTKGGKNAADGKGGL